MSDVDCPNCGTALNFDVLTGEPRPCPNCGTSPPVDEKGHIVASDEHSQNLRNQKFFEVATVITLILVGFGYLAISINQRPIEGDGTSTLTNLASIVSSVDFAQGEAIRAGDHRFHTYTRENDLYTAIDFVTPEADNHVDTIIVSVSLPPGEEMPSDERAGELAQQAFDDVAELSERLVPTSLEGLSKAVKTTSDVSNGDTEFMKGVAQTANGWKITYMLYRKVEPNDSGIPFLLFVYQHLEAASDPGQEAFGKVLFTAANNGNIIRNAFAESPADAE